jgi:polyisoprenoid-binding protein YceI
MKVRLLSLTVLMTAVAALAGWTILNQPLTFEPEGRIWVEGTSTVQAWECEAGQFTGALTGAIEGGSLTGLSATSVSVPVAQLDCGGRQINGKTRSALQGSSHPNIQFTMTGANIGAPNNGRFAVDTRGRLTIAGVTKDVRFTANGRVLADGRYNLTGSVPLLMTDFGIDPPTAMLGALRSGDQVTVRFDVNVRG